MQLRLNPVPSLQSLPDWLGFSSPLLILFPVLFTCERSYASQWMIKCQLKEGRRSLGGGRQGGGVNIL